MLSSPGYSFSFFSPRTIHLVSIDSTKGSTFFIVWLRFNFFILSTFHQRASFYSFYGTSSIYFFILRYSGAAADFSSSYTTTFLGSHPAFFKATLRLWSPPPHFTSLHFTKAIL